MCPQEWGKVDVGLFSKRDEADRPESADRSAPAETDEGSESGHRRKSGPTPTRREAEAARKARVNPTLSKRERRRREAERSRRERAEALERREADPVRALARDVVDSRFRLGEIIMPALLVVLCGSIVTGQQSQLAILTLILFYAIVAAEAVELFLLWRSFVKTADNRFPNHPRRGMFIYIMNRTLQMRRWRQPAPRVKRGDQI